MILQTQIQNGVLCRHVHKLLGCYFKGLEFTAIKPSKLNQLYPSTDLMMFVHVLTNL